MSKKKNKSKSTPRNLTDNIANAKNQRLANSLTQLTAGISYETGDQVSQVSTLFKNNRWYLLSNMRQILSEMYVEHGIVQTLIDIPVDDAFRTGYEITTGMLSSDEIEELEKYVSRNNINQVIGQACKWARLFGGGGLLILTGQRYDTQLKEIRQDSPLMFRAVDMWELYHSENLTTQTGEPFDISTANFNYYTHKVDSSRVLTIKGKEAPSFIRQRLRGWGMSELERLVRSLNSYLKNGSLIFELLDEAKVDVFKIMDLNSALMTDGGTEAVQNRIQLANQLKNYLNALVMDKEDEYDQKQLSFSGLGDMLTQIRQGIASDLKMPMTKLFGISSAGFNSGEDDIENYNAMIEGEVRAKVHYIVVKVLQLCSQHLFGINPEDLEIEWGALRILSSEQEEDIKSKKMDRIITAFSSGLISAEEGKKSINKDNLLPIEVKEDDEIFDNPNINMGLGNE